MSESSNADKLIALMSDGEFHSGEELGRLLSISRAAVWKRLERLKELGLEYESIRGKGYRLKNKLNLLDAAEIRKGLSAVEANNIFIHSIIDSTNAELMRLLVSQEINHGDIVLAEMQEQGRGRRGRSWVSPYAASINLSLYWRFEQGISGVDGLSLVVGLALAEVLNNIHPGFKLKWPNDVVFDGKKVAGILVELTGDPNGILHIVIGIGININIFSSDLFNQVEQPWTSLAQITGKTFNRNELLVSINNKLIQYLTEFQAKGFSSFQQVWQQFDYLKGSEVFVHIGSNIVYGVADGVAANGELRIKTEKGIELFNGGEVSLRKKL